MLMAVNSFICKNRHNKSKRYIAKWADYATYGTNNHCKCNARILIFKLSKMGCHSSQIILEILIKPMLVYFSLVKTSHLRLRCRKYSLKNLLKIMNFLFSYERNFPYVIICLPASHWSQPDETWKSPLVLPWIRIAADFS